MTIEVKFENVIEDIRDNWENINLVILLGKKGDTRYIIGDLVKSKYDDRLNVDIRSNFFTKEFDSHVFAIDYKDGFKEYETKICSS